MKSLPAHTCFASASDRSGLTAARLDVAGRVNRPERRGSRSGRIYCSLEGREGVTAEHVDVRVPDGE